MVVFKRGTSWIAQVYVGVDPTTGRKQYVSRSKPTKREATAIEADLRAEVAQGRRKAMPNSSFGDLLDRWLKAGDWTASTRYNYERLVETRLKPALGHTCPFVR